MSTYGKHSHEAQVQADYEDTKREILAATQCPLRWIAVAAIWVIRVYTVRPIMAARP